MAKQKYEIEITIKLVADSPEKLQGQIIKMTREAAGLSQRQLAEAIHVSRATVAAWEKKGINQDAYRLEKYFGLPHGYFFVEIDNNQ